MILVTGGAGFIGSQLVKGLNKQGYKDVLVVDNLSNGKKFINLSVNDIADYMDKHEFRKVLNTGASFSDNIEYIFHQGACSVTTEWDGQYMMDNNYSYSKELLSFAIERSIPFIYASSAAVYGVNTAFEEKSENESPVNVYGYSKLMFDNFVRSKETEFSSQVVGLRYFNVYGPREAHKQNMASVAYHFNTQIRESGEVRLFEGSHGYGNGEQLRDFIYVDDVVSANLWLMENREISGIFNLGTGMAHSFNDVANAVIDWHGKGKIKYIPFPENLLGSYQSFTQADMNKFQAAGYDKPFTSLTDGVSAYMDELNQ